MADLKDYDVVYVRQPLTAREKMITRLNRFLAGVVDSLGGHTVPPAVRIYKDIGFELERVLELNDPTGVYAYCLICDIN
jgi:hypothetical protein